MTYLKSLSIKFLFVFVVMWLAFTIQTVPFFYTLLISIVYATSSFFIGDLVVLPRYGNLFSTAVDALVAFTLLIISSPFLLGGPLIIGLTALVVAGFIAAGEAIFHRYLEKEFFQNKRQAKRGFENVVPLQQANLQTEFAAEEDFEQAEENSTVMTNYVPHRKRNKNKKNPY